MRPLALIISLFLVALSAAVGAGAAPPETHAVISLEGRPLLQTLMEHPAVTELMASLKGQLERWWSELWQAGVDHHGHPQPLALFAAVGAALSVVTSAIKGALLHHGGPDTSLEDATAAILDAVASGECLERAACHLGHLVRGHSTSEATFSMLTLLPAQPLVQAFRKAATTQGDCTEYRCHAGK